MERPFSESWEGWINITFPSLSIDPKINGIVFLIPKLKPEKEATALFGPGVYPNEHEIPINKNNSGCIKIRL